MTRAAILGRTAISRTPAALCSILTVCLYGCGGTTPTESVPSERPRLILLLVIDQFVWDYIDRYGELFDGGLKHLLDEGALYTNAYYRHATTNTGPGHAVVATGRHPSHSGIIDNDWFDRFLGEKVRVIDDPLYPPVGGPGDSASPARLDGFTLGDVLKVESPGSRVVAVSKKPRSAIMLAGRRGDAAYWYEQGRFITTSYYTDEAPTWLERWNGSGRSDAWLGGTWTRAQEAELYETYAGADDVAGERTPTDRTFPHMFPAEPAAYYEYLEDTPFIDTLTLDVALEVLAAYEMGSDETTDILGIGFSGTDTVGHQYGPASQEALDQILRLDGILGQLFDAVFEHIRREDVLIVVTADHGIAPLVERTVARGESAVRIDEVALRGAVEDALGERFTGASDFIAYMDDETWYLNPAVIAQHGLEQKEVEDVIVDTLMSTGEIEAVFRRTDLGARSGPDHPHRPYFENSLYPSRTADLLALPKKFSYYSSTEDRARHGSSWEYDRHVPMIFVGRGIEPSRIVRDASPIDIAPTLAALLGIDFTKEADAQVLPEVTSGPER